MRHEWGCASSLLSARSNDTVAAVIDAGVIEIQKDTVDFVVDAVKHDVAFTDVSMQDSASHIITMMRYGKTIRNGHSLLEIITYIRQPEGTHI